MSSSKTTVETSLNDEVIVAYYCLCITISGTIFNFLTLTILCRATFRNLKARPTLHYMRAMAIFDIRMLYGWNFDHYLSSIYGFTLQRSSIPLCRFLSFFNYFVSQTSAWLRVFVCLDRYLSLSRLYKTWFSSSKHVLIVIGCIMGVFLLLNSPFFVYGCSTTKKGNILVQSWAFQIYPLWDYVNLSVYNCAPFLLMTIFNSAVIYHLIRLRRTSTVQNSQIQHRSITVTLVVTTFLFLMMTIPGTVVFAFFYSQTSATLKRFLDGILYTYHILSFPLYMITFDEFRGEYITMMTCGKIKPKIPTLAIIRPRLMSTV